MLKDGWKIPMLRLLAFRTRSERTCRVQRDPGEDADAVQRPGRGAEQHARVAEEVRGVLAQAAGRPDVIEAQEAAACEGQAPAAVGVVHGGAGAGARMRIGVGIGDRLGS